MKTRILAEVGMVFIGLTGFMLYSIHSGVSLALSLLMGIAIAVLSGAVIFGREMCLYSKQLRNKMNLITRNMDVLTLCTKEPDEK